MTHANPPRSRRVTVLLSPDELAIADELARAQGVSRSDVLRQPLYAQRPLVGVVTKRASLNLKMLAGSSPVSACCPGSSGHARKSATKLLVGQELRRKESAC